MDRGGGGTGAGSIVRVLTGAPPGDPFDLLHLGAAVGPGAANRRRAVAKLGALLEALAGDGGEGDLWRGHRPGKSAHPFQGAPGACRRAAARRESASHPMTAAAVSTKGMATKFTAFQLW